jgi:single-stranded-DNA-specific exonuclease
MAKSHYQWQYPDAVDPALVKQIQQADELPAAVANILVQRGCQSVEEAEAFLHPDDLTTIVKPDALHDMDKAVTRIEQAVETGEKITVYGDYDADGITSTSLMYETLLTLGANADYYIPDRFQDGYGPNPTVYQRLIDDGTKLIVTVDNGVAGLEALTLAHERGVDVVVTDHHQFADQLPPAAAIVHPQYPGVDYPGGDLSGVGVAFKVAWALLEEFPEELLDLVAIGEIADVVSVAGENRTLISLGLQKMQQKQRLGLHALAQLSGVDEDNVTTEDIGFQIAPRLNALGRVANANDGVRLLTTLNPAEAQSLAEKVDHDNQQRRQLVDQITTQATQQAQSEANCQRQTLLICGHGWHQGVLGIVASRLVEATGKPTIVASTDGGQLYKGSGRSSAGFNLFQALDGHRDLMTAFGGHSQACGLSFQQDAGDKLQSALEEAAANQHLADKGPAKLMISGQLSPEEINLLLAKQIRRLDPFGPGNETPVFEIKQPQITSVSTMGKEGNHLRVNIAGNSGRQTIVAFNQGQLAPVLTAAPAGSVNFAVTLNINQWKGKQSVQLMLKDLQFTAAEVVDSRTSYLTPAMFSEESNYIIYGEQLRENVAGNVNGKVLSPEEARQTDFAGQNVTIVDCPPSLGELAADMMSSQQPAKLRLLLWPQQSHGRAEVPDRQHFAALYRLLKNHRQITWPAGIKQLAAELTIAPATLKFMIQVFYDGGFVTIKDGLLSFNPSPDKVALSSLPTYQRRLARLQAEKLLLKSDQRRLTNWVYEQLTNTWIKGV